jgi:hypothetical protein
LILRLASYKGSTRWLLWAGAALGLFALAFGLAWAASGFQQIDGWGAYLLVLVLAAGMLLAGWLALRREELPGWLGALLCGAAVLRVVAGVVW